MSADALPCLVCGHPLLNVFPDHTTNQPSEGLSFRSEGHYGTTVFDPMDYSFIEINVCDECLTRKGNEGHVYHGREYKPVMAYMDQLPMRVGRTRAHRELTVWQPELDYDEERMEIEPEEVGVLKGVDWLPVFDNKGK